MLFGVFNTDGSVLNGFLKAKAPPPVCVYDMIFGAYTTKLAGLF